MNNPYVTTKDEFQYWQLCNGAWLYSAIAPDLTIKQSWYRKYTRLGEGIWRLYKADGLDNPGVVSSRVAFEDLPAELRLAITLLEK